MSNETPKQQKAALRRESLARRRSLTPREAAEKSAAIAQNLKAVPAFRAARALLTYVASKDNEVDTLPIIQEALAQGRPVFVPVMQPGHAMRWSRLTALSDLEPARFGILEPRPESYCWITPPEPSFCLAPGIAFTRRGERIGYGGGYFDRFLAEYPGISAGLAFELQLVEEFAGENTDIPVDMVITESRVYKR